MIDMHGPGDQSQKFTRCMTVFMWNIYRINRWVVASGCGWHGEYLIANGQGVSFLSDENILKLDCGVSCTTWWIYWNPLSHDFISTKLVFSSETTDIKHCLINKAVLKSGMRWLEVYWPTAFLEKSFCITPQGCGGMFSRCTVIWFSEDSENITAGALKLCWKEESGWRNVLNTEATSGWN